MASNSNSTPAAGPSSSAPSIPAAPTTHARNLSTTLPYLPQIMKLASKGGLGPSHITIHADGLGPNPFSRLGSSPIYQKELGYPQTKLRLRYVSPLYTTRLYTCISLKIPFNLVRDTRRYATDHPISSYHPISWRISCFGGDGRHSNCWRQTQVPHARFNRINAHQTGQLTNYDT